MSLLGNLFVQIMVAYMIFDLASALYNRKNREGIILTNKRLDELRSKPVKTIEEQREFLDLCFSKKKQKYKFKWKDVFYVIRTIAIFIGLMIGLRYIFNILNINLSLMFAIFFILTIPLAVNWGLSKIGLNKHNSLMYLLGLGRKK